LFKLIEQLIIPVSDVGDRRYQNGDSPSQRLEWSADMDKPGEPQLKANKPAVAEMLDLLRGIRIACDDFKQGDNMKALQILESVQERLATLITACAKQ
jgi:hypothetical protein